jgi:hypothetical protein
MMIEASGFRAGSGSGSIPLTSGSGSRRPKNMWIRWIRIRNTAFRYYEKQDRCLSQYFSFLHFSDVFQGKIFNTYLDYSIFEKVA